MQTRPLGRTGVELSLVGLGGIVVADLPQEEANRIVAEAVARGVCYFDVAPSYGNAQDRLGPALQPYRAHSFLACKTAERTAEGAARELAESLRTLRTDYFDLYQVHGLGSVAEVEQVFAPGGAMEVFVKAKEEGTARFLGFSAHHEEAALEAIRRYPFDTVLFPINVVCWEGGFGPRVLRAAEEAGLGRLALKAMARTPWPEGPRRYDKTWYEPLDDPDLAALALRWTLSQSLTAALPPGEPSCFWRAVEVAERYTPLTPEEEAHLKSALAGLAPIFP